MGKDKNESRKWTAAIRKSIDQHGNVADWGSVNPTKVVGLIQAVSAKGGAVRFGYTRDGGAYAIGLYYDGENETTYIKPGEDVDSELDRYTEIFSEMKRSV